MDDQTLKAYWQALSAVLALEEKSSWLRDDKVKAEEAIYEIRPEEDPDGIWEAWADYIQSNMDSQRVLDKIRVSLQKRINA
jgi:hypothetical protein